MENSEKLEELEIQYAKRLSRLERKKRLKARELESIKELEFQIIEEYIKLKEEETKK